MLALGLGAGIVIGFFAIDGGVQMPHHQGTATPCAVGRTLTVNGADTGIMVAYGNTVRLGLLMEALGGSAAQDSHTQQITIRHDGNTMRLYPNMRTATVNRRQRPLSSPLRIVDGHAMVTLDFVTRDMGLGMGFMDERVVITTDAARQVPVLVYHHILPAEAIAVNMPNNPWVISTENFEAQMQYLYENDFYPITIRDMEDFLFHGRNLPARSVMIHFDDGYYSNFVYAAPIMRQFGMRGQLFVITGEVEALGDTQPPMDYGGLTFSAAHTIAAGADVFETASHSHDLHVMAHGTDYTLLMVTPRHDIIADTLRSFDFVQNHTAYVFPLSQHNDYVVNALQDAGITMAFGYHRAPVRRDSNPLSLPRLNVYHTTTMQQFSRFVR
jgi:peptidoglycan/xylan/chitin deacetylase (PgdA/CDA1 family)